MSGVIAARRVAAAQLIDPLMRPGMLVVAELKQGGVFEDPQTLWERCIKHIEHLREGLEHAGLGAAQIGRIIQAQCALLDEKLADLVGATGTPEWARISMQARFCEHHAAGDDLYQDIRQLLSEPAPDIHVLTACHRVLTLGFNGCYRVLEDPQRQQVISALEAQIAPLQPSEALATQSVRRLGRSGHGGGLLRQCAVLAAALGVAWWALNAWLGDAATRLPGLG